ncbi:MAG: FG-GAP repeat domain-containing protein [Bacteroidota bacterium]
MDSPTGNLFARIRTIPALVSLLIFSIPSPTSSQLRQFNSLGIVQSFEFPVGVSRPVLFRYSSARTPDILWYERDSSIFVTLKNNGTGQFTDRKVIGRTGSLTSFVAGNINDDGIDDIVVVHREQNQIELLLSRRSDSTYTASFYNVNFYPEHAVIGDLNNDRLADVMSYGKVSSGVSYLQGKGGGKFLAARTLFENIPVNDLSLVAMNGDNIVDVAVNNWLTNETVLFLGLGKLKFSEQTVLSFAEDSVYIQFLDVNNDHLTDVAISSAKDKTLQILEGDGLGNFSFSQALPLYHLPTEIVKTNFRSATAADLLISDVGSQLFSLVLNKNDGNFYDEIIYGIKQGTKTLLCGDLNGDRLSDVMFLSGNGTSYEVLWNSQSKLSKKGQEISFAVGSHPSNLSVMDLNKDGIDDIAVCNENSSSVSLLLSSGTSYFSGQLTLETPEQPMAVSLYSKNDSSLTLFTTHQGEPQISLITLRKENDSLASLSGDIEQFSIPLPDRPTTVLPDVSYMEKGISLYAFMASSTNSIVFYQQVKGTRFLTRSLVPLVPSKIIYSTINDLNGDGKTDLVYVNSDDKIRSTKFGITMNDSSGNFKGRLFSAELSDSTNRKAFVITDDLNGDQLKDILVFTSPENKLRIALGNKETTYEPFVVISSEMNMKASEQLQQYDFDNDGNLDILYHDRTASELRLFRGKGNGRFFPPVRIADIPKESVFRCGDFNGDSAGDIVYTNPFDASITVIYGN